MAFNTAFNNDVSSRWIVQFAGIWIKVQVSSCFLLPQVGGRHARTSLRARGGEEVNIKAWLGSLLQLIQETSWMLPLEFLVVDTGPAPIVALKWAVTHNYRNVPNHQVSSNLLWFSFDLDLRWLEYFACALNDWCPKGTTWTTNNCNRFLLGHGIIMDSSHHSAQNRQAKRLSWRILRRRASPADGVEPGWFYCPNYRC